MDRELEEAIRQILEEEISSTKVIRRHLRQVVRDGRADLLARVLRASVRLHGPIIEAMLGSPTALTVNQLHRRAGVGLALRLYDARLLDRFTRLFSELFGEDVENLTRLRSQRIKELRYAKLLDEPSAEVLKKTKAHEPGSWFMELMRRAIHRKSPPSLLARLAPLGFESTLKTWRMTVLEALHDSREVRPAVAAWIEDEARSRGWQDKLLRWLVSRAEDRTTPTSHTAGLLLAAPNWRSAAQDLVLHRLARGTWILDDVGRAILSQLGTSDTAIRALEAYAERASRMAREEAAVEMSERFRRETEKRTARMLGPIHRVWAELTIALPSVDPSQRHLFSRMEGALDELMTQLDVEPFGKPGEQVPYRLAIHRYIGHDSPPPSEAPVQVVEPGLRQPADNGKFRIVRKALVT
ncbi:hypothetical protein JYT84_00010 [bacterium AH-315-M10]|nr:hypothetical protein [bacterium AH-315-M10]